MNTQLHSGSSVQAQLHVGAFFVGITLHSLQETDQHIVAVVGVQMLAETEGSVSMLPVLNLTFFCFYCAR